MNLCDVITQQFVDAFETCSRGRAGFLVRLELGGLLLFKFGLAFHRSGGFGERLGEQFPGAMELAADGISRLMRQFGDLVVAEFIVGHE